MADHKTVMAAHDFAAKLVLVMRALSVSRGELAAAIAVDKSLVGRWASGAVSPSDYSLARLSRFVAERHGSFSMADWDRPLDEIGRALGVTTAMAGASVPPPLPGFPPAFLDEARRMSATRGKGYEGFWRTSRPSVIMPGTIFRDHGMIRLDANGFLGVRMGGAGMMFEGVILPGEGNLYAVFFNSVSAAPYFLIAKGVHLPRAETIEGLLLLSALDPLQTPAAVPIVLERIGDLSGDEAADDAVCAELIQRTPVAAEGEVSPEIKARLMRDVGPSAIRSGGEPFLMTALGALVTGSTDGGHLRG